MKKNKMSLTTELDLTREGTAEMTRWCILIALHQSFGVGAARLNKILARAEKLGQESLDIAMMVNDRGMPSTDRSLALRRSWMPRNVDTYKEQGGRCIKRGIAKMTCRKEMRKVGQNNARGEKADCAAKKPERPVLRKIKDPTPLDYDVHDLMTYNAIAKKEGRPELTYGYWAAAGKPARP